MVKSKVKIPKGQSAASVARTQRREKVKLPLSVDKERWVRHPLIVGYQAYTQQHEGSTLRSTAAKLGVTYQALHFWLEKVKKDRHFLLPAERVPAISMLFGIPPYMFRPDLYSKSMNFNKENDDGSRQ